MKRKIAKIRVAVIGLGYWGPNLLRNFLTIPNAEIVYGCDINSVSFKKLARLYPSVKFITDYKKIIKDESIDLITIATPLSTHYKLAREALIAKKHVLLEKPMTKTSKEAKELIGLARINKKTLMVGYTFVYSESVKKIKKLIDEKALGRIYYYDSVRINLGLIQNDINVIWDLACHDLSIINYLIKNKPVAVQAFGSKFIGKHEEIAHLIISYEGNITAHISVSWLSPVKIRTILVGGSKKMIVYDDISPNEKIKIYNKTIDYSPSKITPFAPAYRSGDIITPNISQNESLENELKHLVNCIIKNEKPLTDGVEGLKILKILEASDLSLKNKSTVKIKL
jgi:predicted dehydrogenase